jgi:hypothetical protein
VSNPSYITTYKSMGGWKAVLLWWNPELGGFYEPMQTSDGFETKDQAVSWGKMWAKDEGVEFKER